jgi:MFS family permease
MGVHVDGLNGSDARSPVVGRSYGGTPLTGNDGPRMTVTTSSTVADRRPKLAADAVSDPPRSAGSPPLGRLGLFVALGAALVVVLDFSIVNVALPSRSVEMGVSTMTAEWVVTAYALTFGGLLVVGGRASDLFGRPRLLVAGLVLFAIASAAGGVAIDFPLLVAARAVQGMAAALVAPAALSILTTSYPEGPARERVIGYYGMTASLGFVVGLVAGGVLVDTVGWRGVFFVNVPVCLVLAALGRKALPGGTRVAGDRHLDLPGALLVTAGMAALVYAPTLGTDDGWGSVEFVASLLVSVVLILGFLHVERHSRQPIIPLSIFRHHTLVVGDALMALVGALMAGEVLVLSLYAQEVLGYSPLVSGLIAIPQGVGGLLRGLVAARLLDRVGLKWFLAGNWLLAAVSISLLFRFPVTSHYPVLGILLLGVGFGTTNVIFGGTVAGSTGVSNSEQGVAGALVNAARQIGAAIGVAVVLSVAVLDGGTPVSGGASAAGYRLALLCWAGVAVAAAVFSLALPTRGRTHRKPAPAPDAPRRVSSPLRGTA